MSGAQSIYTRRAYGVQQVCRVWHCARSSVYAWRQAILSSAPRRPADHGPVGQPDGGRDSTTHTTSTVRIMVTSEMSGDTNRPMAGCDLAGASITRGSRHRARAIRRAPSLMARDQSGCSSGPPPRTIA